MIVRLRVGGDARRIGIEAREQLRLLWNENGVRVRFQLNPCARVAAIVHSIIHHPRVAAHGDAAAGGTEIRLGRNRVLLIRQMVPDVRQ